MAAGVGEVAAAAGAKGHAAAGAEGRATTGVYAGASGDCAGAGGDCCSWSGGTDRGSGAPAHPRSKGVSPTSVRYCWAWRISNLRGRGEFQKLGRGNMK